MTITTRKLKNGKTAYDVRVRASGQPSRVCHTMHDAKLLESELIAHTRKGCEQTLKHYIDVHYWPVAVMRLAPSSCDTYRQEIDKRIIPALGDFPLRAITRADIQTRLVDKCATSGIARKSVNTLKTILNEALHDGYITTNYACSKFAPPSTQPRKRDNGLVLQSFAEINAFLDLVDDYAPVALQRIAYSGLLQGLRPEERYALNWSSFDLTMQTLTINQAFTTASRKHGGGMLKDTKTKNSVRVLPMHPRFAAFLMSTPHVGNGAFILSASGQRITPSTAQKQWRRFLDAHSDCPRITIENMRHSFATAYLAAGGRIETLSRILGHSNISTTINRYYRPDVDILRADFSAAAKF